MTEPKRSGEIERYRALLVKDPKSRAFAQLADALRRQGQYWEAIGVCERGLQQYPTYVSARMVLARALREQGEAARAEAEFRRVLELTPDSVAAHRELGDLLRDQGRAADAIEVYETLLQLTPFDREVRELLDTMEPPATAAAPPPQAEPVPGVGPEATLEPVAAGSTPILPTYDLTEAAAEDLALSLQPVEADLGSEPAAGPAGLPATETLADLYVAQGFPEDGRAIYEELLRAAPEREDLRAKLTALGEVLPPWRPMPEGVPEPVGAAVPSALPGAAAMELLPILEAWIGAARSLRAERGRR